MTNPYQYSDLGAGTLGTSSITSSVTTFAPATGATAATFPQSGPFDIRISQSGNVELATVGATTGGSSPTWSSITRGIGTPVAIGPFAFTAGAVITQVLTEEGLTQMPLAGDATGPANASTIFSLAAGLITVAATTAALIFGATTNPSISQTGAAAAAVDAGSAGLGMAIVAQPGEQTTRDGGAGGNGGGLWLSGGPAGDAGHGGTLGSAGPVYIGLIDGGAGSLLFAPATKLDNLQNWGQWGNQPANISGYQITMQWDAGNPYAASTILEQCTVNSVLAPCVTFNAGGNSAADLALSDQGGLLISTSFNAGVASFNVGNTPSIVFAPSSISYSNSVNPNVAANQNVSWTYAAQATQSTANGATGAAVLQEAQPGQPATGAGHAGGKGGDTLVYLAPGGTGTADAGASGNFAVVGDAGPVFSMGYAAHNAFTTVTFATTGTTTVTPLQGEFERIVLSSSTTAANTILALPNTNGEWHIDTSQVTLGATFTLTFSSGSASCPAISSLTADDIYIVSSRGGNTIACK